MKPYLSQKVMPDIKYIVWLLKTSLMKQTSTFLSDLPLSGISNRFSYPLLDVKSSFSSPKISQYFQSVPLVQYSIAVRMMSCSYLQLNISMLCYEGQKITSLSLSANPSRKNLFARLGSKFRLSISFLRSIISSSYFCLILFIKFSYFHRTNKKTRNKTKSKPTTQRVLIPCLCGIP